MGFVSDHNNVGPVRKLGVRFPLLGMKLLDECEDKPVILVQQLFQMLSTASPNLVFRFRDNAGACEVLINLIVEILTICDHQKGPIAEQPA